MSIATPAGGEIGKNRIDKDEVLPYTIFCVAVRPARLIRGVAQFG